VSGRPATFKRAAPAALISLFCVWSAEPRHRFPEPATQHQQAPQSQADAAKKLTWHTLEFAIVRFNGGTPNSWNIYHSQKKGVLLVRLWKRYLLVRVNDEEVYDIDPQKVKNVGDSVEWSYSDLPLKAIDTPDWRERDIGTMERIRFKLGGPDHHYLELQIPLLINGKPLY